MLLIISVCVSFVWGARRRGWRVAGGSPLKDSHSNNVSFQTSEKREKKMQKKMQKKQKQKRRLAGRGRFSSTYCKKSPRENMMLTRVQPPHTLTFTMLDFLNNIWTVFGGHICSPAQSSWLDVRVNVSSSLEEKRKKRPVFVPVATFLGCEFWLAGRRWPNCPSTSTKQCSRSPSERVKRLPLVRQAMNCGNQAYGCDGLPQMASFYFFSLLYFFLVFVKIVFGTLSDTHVT